jgi:hypothetical protein
MSIRFPARTAGGNVEDVIAVSGGEVLLLDFH